MLPRLCRGVALVLLALLVLAAPARAQSAATPPANAPSADELKTLVDALNDPAQRQKLVDELQALIAAENGQAPAEATPATMFDQLSLQVDAITGEILAAAQVVVDAPRLAHWLDGQISNQAARDFWAAVALRLALIFGVGLIADRAAWLLLRGAQRRLAATQGATAWTRLFLMLLAMVIEALPPVAFAAAAAFTVPFTQPDYGTRQVAHVLIGAVLWARIVLALARIALLAPPAQALYPLGGETRQYLYIWMRRFTGWVVYGYAVASAAWWLGVPGAIYALVLRGTILMLAVLAIVFVLQNRRGVADWLRGAPGGGGWRVLRNRLADTWHVLAIVYVIGSFGVYAVRIGGGYLFLLRATVVTVVVLLAAALVVRFAEQLSVRGFAVSPEVKTRYPTLETRANRYLPVLYYLTAALVYVFAALAVLQAWGVDAFAWFGTEAGKRATGTLATIAVVLAAALIVWELFSSAVERYLQVGTAGGPVARHARVRTLLPLMRTTMLVVIVTFVALIVLSQIGVDIAPLLAGAGIVGIAVGFGSQALVKDVITGLFILIEDTLVVGDVVDVGGDHAGVVEAISIRVIRLRDMAGTVHTVPFSAVNTVKNLTKDFSYYVADVGVAYREDTDKVIAVLRDVADEMRRDNSLGPLMLEPMEVVGVDRFEDSAVIIKVRFKTPPIQQWTVGREFNRRMKMAFDRHGIEMPFPHRTIYFGNTGADEGAPDGAAPPKTGG